MSCDREKKVWMDEGLELALYRLAEENGHKFSPYVRLILQRHVDDCARQVVTKEGPQRSGEVRIQPHTERIRDLANRERRRIGVPGMPSEDE